MRDAMERAKKDNLLGTLTCDPVTVRIECDKAWKDSRNQRFGVHRYPEERPSDIFKKCELIKETTDDR